MIVDEIFGDMFKSDCQTYGIPVNTSSVMGAGLARYAKLRWPNIEAIYKRHCVQKTFRTRLVTIPVTDNRQILLIPTKNFWQEDSNEWLVERSLKMLARDWKELGIQTLALPRIGCGRGNMEFDLVRSLIYKYLNDIALPVKLYV